MKKIVNKYIQKKGFDPNAAANPEAGIFNLTCTREESTVVIVPVPWEATTSYGGGTSQGPSAILEASKQLDLGDLELDKPWQCGVHMLPEDGDIKKLNSKTKKLCQNVIKSGGGDRPQDVLEKIDSAGGEVNNFVSMQVSSILDEGKIPGVVGGDHSVPLGAFRAMGDRGNFGLLHFDAHLDMRDSFEGFKYSHASVLRNALDEVQAITKVVQVGIRDFGPEELQYLKNQGGRVKTYFDKDLSSRKFRGESWENLTREIISHLPESVWITFDIDGLDPYLCPHTGTPVPGGLNFREAENLIRAVALSGRKIIGFDLNEVAPGPNDEWDANVGMRVLYKLCSWSLYSQGKVKKVK